MYSEKRRVTDEIKKINKSCLYFLVPGCSEVQKCQCQLNGRRPPETVWVSSDDDVRVEKMLTINLCITSKYELLYV